MFTGLIQAVGHVASLERRGRGARLTVRASFGAEPAEIGESIAVDGACLTVAELLTSGFRADLSPETLARTTAGAWRRGRRVNLERALRLSDRLGGHLVQGHVDARGTVVSSTKGGAQRILRVGYPSGLGRLIAQKGSVTVDGVSLTVSALGPGWFEAALIPHTLEATNLADRRAGDSVNLEADMIARYLASLLKEIALPLSRQHRRAADGTTEGAVSMSRTTRKKTLPGRTRGNRRSSS